MKLGRRIRWTGTHRPKFSIQDCALVVVMVMVGGPVVALFATIGLWASKP